MTFGLQVDEVASFAILDHAAEKGITFLDTADAYPLGGDLTTAGRTEEILGKWLHGKRENYVVATKCFAPMGPNRWDMGNSRRHIMDAVDASLRRLQTDFIDLYQLHFDDPGVPLEESLGIARFDSVQPRYNLLFREFERELFPLCLDEGVGVIPYNPIAGGMLSGKHDRSKPPEEGTRFTLGNAARTYQDRYWHENVFDTVDALVKVADSAGMPLPTLAVAWTLQHPAITAPIVGASRPEQLDATCAALDTPLEPDLVETLNDLTAPYRRGDAPR